MSMVFENIHLIAHIGVVIEHPRDRRRGDACQVGHLVDLDHDRVTSVETVLLQDLLIDLDTGPGSRGTVTQPLS